MRVLYYNWADTADPEQRGGGVGVYQRNLIEGLADQADVETASLSAGLVHDLTPAAPRVVRLSGGPCPRYALVNSGLIAPSHADFAGAAQLDHAATEAAFARFIDQTGPWDVIHFNTLEGLPASVLALRDRWPDTRFVLSLHNFYPFCPQVNLWHAERRACTDFEGGARCMTCLPKLPEAGSIRTAYAVGTALSRIGAGPGTVLHDRVFRPALRLAWRGFRRMARRAPAPASTGQTTRRIGTADHFATRRARMINLINQHCDAVLSVSDRVRAIAVGFGLETTLCHTQLIGTREAEAWQRTQPRDAFLRADGTLQLAYLGYMRRDKGFHFLMRSLSALPADIAERIHLTLAARPGDPEALALVPPVKARLASLRLVNGYTHDDLDTLLADVDLGVIPVMWEDNLPQVAIEMHARHIPLLCADRGGARELGNCDALVFRAGDADDLSRMLADVLHGNVAPADYWRDASPPTGMAQHIDALLALYRGLN